MKVILSIRWTIADCGLSSCIAHCDSVSVLTAIFPGGPGLAGTRMSPFWILLELGMMEVAVGTGAINRHTDFQSVHYHQQTNTQFTSSWRKRLNFCRCHYDQYLYVKGHFNFCNCWPKTVYVSSCHLVHKFTYFLMFGRYCGIWTEAFFQGKQR